MIVPYTNRNTKTINILYLITVSKKISANYNFNMRNISNFQFGPGNFKWTVKKGSTPSSRTGPIKDENGSGTH